AVIPAVLSVAVLVLWVREPSRSSPTKTQAFGFDSWKTLPKAYWVVVVLGAVLTLARFSEAFLIIRGQELGIALAMVPIVLVVMNIAYTAIAYPAGLAADRGYRNALLVSGFIALIASDLILAATQAKSA